MDIPTKQNDFYMLQVLRVNGIFTRSRSSKALKIYVKASVDDFSDRTPVSTATDNPSWDTKFNFQAKASSKLRLRLKRESRMPGPNKSLGELDVEIGQLVTQGKGGSEISMKLRGPQAQDATLVIRFSEVDISEAAARAISAIQETVVSSANSAETLSAIVSKLEVLAGVIDEAAKIHPYVNFAWKATSAAYKVVKGQLDRDEQVSNLMTSMCDAYSFVDDMVSVPDKVKSLQNTVQAILQQTFECALFIREYCGRGFAANALRDTFSKNATDAIDKFTRKFTELKAAFDNGVNVQTAIISSRILEKVETIATEQTLQKLNPAPMDQYGRTECIPGTRLDLITFATDWVLDPETDERVLWFHGVAGSGKSTLSTTLARLFEEMGRLGAFVFFSRGVAERNSPGPVTKTIAYQLASYDRRMGHGVAAIIDSAATVLRSPSRMQFQKLVVEPLASIEGIETEGPIVIILDALDECGKPEDRMELLKVLADHTATLTRTVRTIIFSRPEHDIQRHFELDHIRAHKLNLDSDDTQRDIETFIRQRMSDIREANSSLPLPHDWPGQALIRALVEKASGLFIWASTACKFIADAYEPETRLREILQAGKTGSAESSLDQLYVTALKSVGDIWSDLSFSADFRSIMGLILVARDTLSVASIEKLLQLSNQKPLSHALRRLGCVLYYNGSIRVLHPSFGDFLCNRDRCQSDAWYIDVASHNHRAALQCLNHLDTLLKFNICDLAYPTASNVGSSSAGAQLPNDVVYACVYWVDHFCGLENNTYAIGERLESFLFKHLLHWIEAMSILKRTTDATHMMKSLLGWIDLALTDQIKLRALVDDGHRFLQAFVQCIEHHPLFVYTGALPFTPVDTTLYQTFQDPTIFPSLVGQSERTWSPLILSLGQPREVMPIAFSPDGTLIASGCRDGAMRIYSTKTGAQMVTDFEIWSAHPESNRPWIGSLDFSPDGSRIVSMSVHGHVNHVDVWSTSTGAHLLGPLSISALDTRGGQMACFSPDGKIIGQLASGRLALWDSSSGSALFHPRDVSVNTHDLHFSSGSLHVITVSETGFVCYWDTRSGAQSLTPLQTPHRCITSHYIPEESHLLILTRAPAHRLSLNLQTWDLRLHVCVKDVSLCDVEVKDGWGPGHLVDGVDHEVDPNAVFSADGSQILLWADGGLKGYVGVWDVASGHRIFLTDRVHDQGLTFAAAISPDRSIFAIGCLQSLRLWDAMAFSTVTQPRGTLPVDGLDGILSAPSAAFAGNGRTVVVGSRQDQHEMRVLDVTSGADICEPIREHDSIMSCVAVSFDGSLVAERFDNTLSIWDLTSGSGIRHEGPDEMAVPFVAFAPDGGRVVTSLESNTIHLCNTRSSSPPIVLAKFPMLISAAFSNDGTRIVSVSGNHWRGTESLICVWDAFSGSLLLGPLSSNRTNVSSISFSPNDRFIVSHCGEGNFKKWDASTGLQVDAGPVQSFQVHNCHAQDQIVVGRTNGLIMDRANDRILSKLPPSIGVVITTSSRNALLVRTQDEALILHFPPIMLTG